MTIELWMALAAVGLTLVLILAAATPTLLANPMWALGPRDEPFAVDGVIVRRLGRAADNMKENLPLFGVLALIVHAAGAGDATTALGAQLFVGARVVHAILYVAGVAYLRTLAWFASIVGMVMMAAALL